MEQILDSNASSNSIGINNEGANYLHQSARWARFLGIVGFIFCGLFVVIGLFSGVALSSAMETLGGPMAKYGGALSMIYVAVAALYFFPCLYLYRFGTAGKDALESKDEQRITLALMNLKSCFKFMGIFTIIILAIYAIIILVAIMAAAF
ncbi:MAG: DUF5362 family protein [Bacteroidia bacterium]